MDSNRISGILWDLVWDDSGFLTILQGLFQGFFGIPPGVRDDLGFLAILQRYFKGFFRISPGFPGIVQDSTRIFGIIWGFLMIHQRLSQGFHQDFRDYLGFHWDFTGISGEFKDFFPKNVIDPSKVFSRIAGDSTRIFGMCNILLQICRQSLIHSSGMGEDCLGLCNDW